MLTNVRLGVGLPSEVIAETGRAIEGRLAGHDLKAALDLAHALVEKVLVARLGGTTEFALPHRGGPWKVGDLLQMALYYRIATPTEVRRFLRHSKLHTRAAHGEAFNVAMAPAAAREMREFAHALNCTTSDLSSPPVPRPIFLAALEKVRHHVDPQRRFAVSIPLDWSERLDPRLGLVFSPGDAYPMFSLQIAPVPQAKGDATLNDYPHVTTIWRREFTSRGLTPTDDAMVAGFPAVQYLQRIPDKKYGELHSRLLFFIARGSMYTLTFGSAQRDFPALAAIFEGIIQSFCVGTEPGANLRREATSSG